MALHGLEPSIRPLPCGSLEKGANRSKGDRVDYGYVLLPKPGRALRSSAQILIRWREVAQAGLDGSTLERKVWIMAGMKPHEPTGSVPSASELRRQLAEKQMASLERNRKAEQREKEKLAAFMDDFMSGHVSENERARMRKQVVDAVEQGRMEVLIYTFPSSLCSDDGRAINSGDKNWPDTLQGKAKVLFDRFQTALRPQGYRLKAQIISFPGGMPGDVGLYLGWSD